MDAWPGKSAAFQNHIAPFNCNVGLIAANNGKIWAATVQANRIPDLDFRTYCLQNISTLL